jgi:MFS family permease
VAHDPRLLAAVRSGSDARVRRYVDSEFPAVWCHWHVSRLRITRDDKTVVETGPARPAGRGAARGLAGLFLVVALHHPSHALAGATLFAVFSAAVIAQFATIQWPLRRLLAAGMAAMVLGLAGTVTAVWLPTSSLALFILGGAVTGAGGGAVFKGAVGTVIAISPPETRAGALSGTYLAAFVGLSLPIVGAGVALTAGLGPRLTLLAFAIAVSLGIAASAIKLLGWPHARAPQVAHGVGRVIVRR